MSLLPLFGKKKPKNRYSERKSISLSRENGAGKRSNRSMRYSRREWKRPRISLKSFMGFFSAATILTVCAAAFIAVAIGLIFVYRWATNSDYFALRNIEVRGINNLSYTEVLAQADVQTGQNSLDLSLDVIEAKLLSNPWVNEVSVKRELPDSLIITIMEHEPSYWTLNNGHMFYADRDGKLIAEVNSNKFLALPILEIDRNSGNLAGQLDITAEKMASMIASLPSEYQTPALYRLSRAAGIEVHFEGKNLSLLLGLENIDQNIKYMQLVLNDLKMRNELDRTKEVRAHDGKVWVVVNEM